MWALAVDMAEQRQRVLFVSLEQTAEEAGLQALSRFSGITLDRVALAHNPEAGVYLSDAEESALTAAEERLARLDKYLRLHGASAQGRSLEDVLTSATRVRWDAIFIDHIGMIDRDRDGDELKKLPRVINRLRALTRGEVVAGYRPFVCATSPLNRGADGEDGKERAPSLSDFRGSGLIESDADLAMVLRKRQRDGEAEGPDIVDGFVIKNRQGRCPVVLQFEADGAICCVTERRPENQAPPNHWQDGTEED